MSGICKPDESEGLLAGKKAAEEIAESWQLLPKVRGTWGATAEPPDTVSQGISRETTSSQEPV